MAQHAQIDPARLAAATDLLDTAVRERFMPGYASAVYRGGAPVAVSCAGMRKPGDPPDR